MKQSSDFWDKHAAHYDRFLRRDMAAYQQMYELICPAVRHKTVLELATGTGLIASHIINAAEQIEATDASEEMIHLAKEANRSSKLHFSVQDMFHLPYADHSFDVAIVSNALHIVPQPEKALAEACRVLKDDGLAHCPHFHPWGQYTVGAGSILFHAAVRFSASQQMDLRGISGIFAAVRLARPNKPGASGIVPLDLRGMYQIGGMNHVEKGNGISAAGNEPDVPGQGDLQADEHRLDR